MDNWSVFLVIAALVAFLATVVPPIVKLNSSITKLTDCFDSLTKQLAKIEKKNDESHDKMWAEINDHDDTINNHETRIQLIEKENKK